MGEHFFTIFLGPQWAEAGRYVQVLGPWTFFWFISSPLATVFSVLERQGNALVVHSAVLLSRAGALVIGGARQSVFLALTLFSVSGVLIYGAMLLWVTTLSGVRLVALLRVLLNHLGYAVALVLGIEIVKSLAHNSDVVVVTWSMLFASLYYAVRFRRQIGTTVMRWRA